MNDYDDDDDDGVRLLSTAQLALCMTPDAHVKCLYSCIGVRRVSVTQTVNPFSTWRLHITQWTIKNETFYF